MEEKINAIMMLEIMGKPPEHVTEMLEKIVDRIGDQKNVEIISKKFAEPKKLEEKELFTSYAEIEIETSLQTLMMLCFAYMPSHVDIISPEQLRLKNADLGSFLNELLRRLHKYDELAKTISFERQQLQKMIKEGKVKVLKGSGDKKEDKKQKENSDKSSKK